MHFYTILFGLSATAVACSSTSGPQGQPDTTDGGDPDAATSTGGDGGADAPLDANTSADTAAEASGPATCGSDTDCKTDAAATGACAPVTNASLHPIGPYVCKPDDGLPYDGCLSQPCWAGFCCLPLFGAAGSADTAYPICQAACSIDSECEAPATCLPLLSGTCFGGMKVCGIQP